MDKRNKHIDSLIIKYSKNNLTIAEEQELLNWVEESVENKIYFKELLGVIRNINLSTPQIDKNPITKKIRRKSDKFVSLSSRWTVAASLIILISVGVLICWISSKYSPVTYQSAYNGTLPKGYYLPDSSVITLADNSIIQLDKKFNKEKRRVTLNGKGFFKIEKDSLKPFIVKALDVEIKVLGTQFEVDIDSLKENVRISVTEGRVQVKHRKIKDNFFLEKDQMLMLNKHGKIVKQEKLNDNNYLVWKTGTLLFHNTHIGEVVEQISQYYNVGITIKDPEINNFLITTKIQNQSLQDVIFILEKSLGIDIEKKDNNLILALKQTK